MDSPVTPVLDTAVPSGLIPCSAAADFSLLLAKLPSEGNVLGFRDTAPISKLAQLSSHVNKRFREIIQEGPADCYIAAFFLDPRYVGCDVLRRSLNPLAPTITIPPPIPRTLEETVPNQRVFGRVMEYLKTVVEPEWKSKENPMLKGLTRLQVQESFVRQLRRYARLQYPFDAPVEAGQSILSWWTHLTRIPEGAVLACIAQKIFSVKPNDMPEERTMSVFTRMNSALRNRQHVKTLVDMTQIRQWHMYDPEKFRLREQPTLDFFDVEQVIFGKGQSTASRTHNITGSSLIIENADEHEEILDEDTHTWLDDKIENMPGDSTFDAEEDIDLDVPELTKILADDPPQGSVSKGEKREKTVACIDDADDADGEWVWK